MSRNWNSVNSISFMSRTRYASLDWPSYFSEALESNADWKPIWHPIYGACFLFRSKEDIKQYVGNAGEY